MKFLKNSDARFEKLGRRVGWFTITAFAVALGLGAFIVTSQEWFRPSRSYVLHAVSSQGVSTGMAIRLSGFRIGTVDAVELEGEGLVRVDITVFEDYAQYLRGDSTAQLQTDGLLGDSFIEITSGSGNSRQLGDGETLALTPESSMGGVVEKLRDEIIPVVQRIDTLLVYLNDPEGDLKRTFANISTATDGLRDSLPAALGETERAAASGAELIAGLADESGPLQSSLTNTAALTADLQQSVPPLLEETRLTLAELTKVAREAESLVATTTAVAEELQLLVQESRAEIPDLLRQGNETLEEAHTVIGATKRIWPLSKAVAKDADSPILRANGGPR